MQTTLSDNWMIVKIFLKLEHLKINTIKISSITITEKVALFFRLKSKIDL